MQQLSSDFCGSSTCALGEAYKPVGSADWAYKVPMNVSWAGLVVAALIAIWGFMQLPQ